MGSSIETTSEVAPKAALRPEIVFVLVAGLFGLLLVSVVPPFQVPDENVHFTYAYALSTGDVYGYESVIPSTIRWLESETLSLPFNGSARIKYADLAKYVYTPLNPGSTDPVTYQHAARNNPIPYLPVAVGMRLATWLRFTVFDFFYFGRIVNLVVWILLGFFAIRALPARRWAYLSLFLMPMSLFQAASYSVDSVVNAVCFFWFATCMRSASEEEGALSRASMWGLMASAAAVAFTKPPYLLLLGLFFLIPRHKFGSRDQYRRAVIAMAVVALAGAVVSAVYFANDHSITGIPEPGTSFSGQLLSIVQHPLEFPRAVVSAVQAEWLFWYRSTVGILGWLDTALPDYVYLTYPLVVLAAALLDRQPGGSLSSSQRLICLACAALTFTAVLFSMYVTWSPVGARAVQGVQGRYLIPILPLFVPLLQNRYVAIPERWLGIIATSYVVVILIITVRTLLFRYYV